MLLRRFISNIKDRDWGSVVAELLIVVVGVFFGIQAANWNADRLEQSAEKLAEAAAALRSDPEI